MKTRDIHIIINPAAGNGKANLVATRLMKRLGSYSESLIILSHTATRDEATGITRRALKNGAGLIVAVGGDGTINEVVNGFFNGREPLNPECELGIINCGTGGGYAKTLNLPGSLEDQISLILRPHSLMLDVGHISFMDPDGRKSSRLFVNECQVGIGSTVAAKTGKRVKKLGGTLAFGITAAIQAVLFRPMTINLQFDNESASDFRLIGLVAGNGVECAGGMRLTPDARLNDGLFDVLSIHEMNVLNRLISFPKIYSGQHINGKEFSLKKCRSLRIRSDISITLEADGEIIGSSPFDLEMIPSAIRVKADF